MKTKNTRMLVAALTGWAFVLVGTASAQPKKKPKPATEADIARIEKRIDDQQKTIDKLVKLQQQYAQAMAQILDLNLGPSASAPVDKPKADKADKPDKPDRHEPATASVTDAMPKAVEARPAVTVAPKSALKPKKVEDADDAAVGTIVGKIANGADAIVYLEDIVASTRGATASMKQEGKEFLPKVLVVTKGTKVDFPNRDAIFHNVFSLTPEASFDLGSYRQGETRSVTMSKTGVVTVYCNMHPQMVGHILVVPNGNYVRAGKDGFFRMANVPAGSHRVVAWAPNSKPVVVQTTVDDAQVATVEMTLKRGRSLPHTKKDGLPYGSYDK